MEYLEAYQKWCEEETFDKETRNELKSISNNEEEIKDRFYQELEFGTAGLRGILGNGTNRMNRYTVTKATQGLANYILEQGTKEKGVAISYDSRHMSKEFAEQTALCLNANGIKTYIFEELRPVPELSFAVRTLGCTAGIMITASHNPPNYNGYKVYWADGSQITSPVDKDIIAEVRKMQDYSAIKTIDKEQAIQDGKYQVIGTEMDDRYLEEIKKQVLNPKIIQEMGDTLRIVYTPLHGTGNIPVRRVLSELGFTKVFIVPEQAEPDGDFPTVEYPNPEDKKAFTLALALGEKEQADVILATDPDADRLGVYAKDSKTGEYMAFTGNMSAMVIAEYLLEQKKEKGLLPHNGAFLKSIVSTNLADAIAKEYDVELIEVLTGFKYIGAKIKEFEETKEKEYIFGFEESYGCLAGTYARDKDGIAAVMLLCEVAAYYKKQGLTLWDAMLHIYEKYGYYLEGVTAITMQGADGAQKIKDIMEMLRNHAPTKFGDYQVIKAKDYQSGECHNIVTDEIEKIDLPSSNVLYYDLEDNSWCCVRPSGTEPKIKFYMGVKGSSMKEANEKLSMLKNAVIEKIG